MPSESLAFVLAFGGLIGTIDTLILYSAYLSVSVWRGLSVPIFRSRALWMALLGIPLVSALTYRFLTSLILPSSSPYVSPLISDSIFTIFLFALFVWVDRTVSSVIRLDYFRRDLLRWKNFRYVSWASFIFGNLLYLSDRIGASNLASVGTIFVSASLAYGSMCFVKGARATGDMTFRLHIKWFGFLIASLVPTLVIYSLVGLSVIDFPFMGALAFCFYKMTRFLVPVSRLPIS